MTWKERTVVRILLIVARMLASNDDLSKEIRDLANHISAHREPGEPVL